VAAIARKRSAAIGAVHPMTARAMVKTVAAARFCGGGHCH